MRVRAQAEGKCKQAAGEPVADGVLACRAQGNTTSARVRARTEGSGQQAAGAGPGASQADTSVSLAPVQADPLQNVGAGRKKGADTLPACVGRAAVALISAGASSAPIMRASVSTRWRTPVTLISVASSL